jgi:hypothetical protein
VYGLGRKQSAGHKTSGSPLTQFLTGVWTLTAVLVGSGLTFGIQARLARVEYKRRARAERRARLLSQFAELNAAAMDLLRLSKMIPDAVEDKVENQPSNFGRLFGRSWDATPWLTRIERAGKMLEDKADGLNLTAEQVELDLGYTSWAPYRSLVKGVVDMEEALRRLASTSESDTGKLSQLRSHVDGVEQLVTNLKDAGIHELRKLEEE